MFKKFKEFAGNRPVYATPNGSNTTIYSYNGNTIAYIDYAQTIDGSLVFGSIQKCSSIEDIFKLESKKDEEPFNFEAVDIKTNKEKITSTKLVKMFSSFSKFYDTESNRTELSGVHIKSGTLFATDAFIMKLSKNDFFTSFNNMVVDINPMMDYLDINSKKISNTNKSLFKSNTVKNDDITIGYIDNEKNSGLYLEIDSLKFLVISICPSELDFSFVKNFKPKYKVEVHTQTLLREISKLIDLEKVDIDTSKDMIRLDVSDKLKVSLYEYGGETSIYTEIPCKSNSTESFCINGRRLTQLLKEIKDTKVTLYVNEEKRMLRINSENTKDLLMLAGSILY